MHECKDESEIYNFHWITLGFLGGTYLTQCVCNKTLKKNVSSLGLVKLPYFQLSQWSEMKWNVVMSQWSELQKKVNIKKII